MSETEANVLPYLAIDQPGDLGQLAQLLFCLLCKVESSLYQTEDGP